MSKSSTLWMSFLSTQAMVFAISLPAILLSTTKERSKLFS
jgi:hypothetical protein